MRPKSSCPVTVRSALNRVRFSVPSSSFSNTFEVSRILPFFALSVEPVRKMRECRRLSRLYPPLSLDRVESAAAVTTDHGYSTAGR